MNEEQAVQPPATQDMSKDTAITARCGDCGTTLWSPRRRSCGACGSKNLTLLIEQFVDRALLDPEGEELVGVVVITRDSEGDILMRDATRDGCLCHARTELGAFRIMLGVRKIYDEHHGEAAKG